MKEIWIVDDDEEMGRAISLMLNLLDCTTKYFFNPRTSRKSSLLIVKPQQGGS